MTDEKDLLKQETSESFEKFLKVNNNKLLDILE